MNGIKSADEFLGRTDQKMNTIMESLNLHIKVFLQKNREEQKNFSSAFYNHDSTVMILLGHSDKKNRYEIVSLTQGQEPIFYGVQVEGNTFNVSSIKQTNTLCKASAHVYKEFEKEINELLNEHNDIHPIY